MASEADDDEFSLSAQSPERDLSALSLLDYIANKDVPLEPIHYEPDLGDVDVASLSTLLANPDSLLSAAASSTKGHSFWEQRQIGASWRRWTGNTACASALMGSDAALYISPGLDSFELVIKDCAPLELKEALGVQDYTRPTKGERARRCLFRGAVRDTRAQCQLVRELDYQVRPSQRWCDTPSEINEKRLSFNAESVIITVSEDSTASPPVAEKVLERPCEVHFSAVETGGKMTVGGEGSNHAAETIRIAPKQGVLVPPEDPLRADWRVHSIAVATRVRPKVEALCTLDFATGFIQQIRTQHRAAQKYFPSFRQNGSRNYLSREETEQRRTEKRATLEGALFGAFPM